MTISKVHIYYHTLTSVQTTIEGLSTNIIEIRRFLLYFKIHGKIKFIKIKGHICSSNLWPLERDFLFG